ncbi:MAG: GyrI-like domain-containing protein [Chitinophagaceae bacterium]
MSKEAIAAVHLIGLSLPGKTINKNGQSSIDCKKLWHQFDDGNYAASITHKLSNDIYGVYHQYDGDSGQPFSYFIGCKVAKDTAPPEGLVGLTIPAGTYEKISATGKMPDCVIKAWKDIWTAGLNRTYHTDFEVYDDRSKDWNNAEVDVYVSVSDFPLPQ